MQHWRDALRNLIASRRQPRRRKPRGLKRLELSCHALEERVTPSQFGPISQLATAAHAQVITHATGTTTQLSTPTSPGNSYSGNSTSSTGTVGWSPGTGTSSSNSALKSALQTLRTEIQSIESKSTTTIGQLTAIRAAFETLSSDGLKLSSYSALRSFENSLVTSATTETLAGNTGLLNQFIALYTSSPTTQQTNDLTTAYNALAAAVTDAGITSTDISNINTDWSKVLAAQNSTSSSTTTSSATFPYFSLVTGQEHGAGLGFEGAC
jgi:hypothetical protein